MNKAKNKLVPNACAAWVAGSILLFSHQAWGAEAPVRAPVCLEQQLGSEQAAIDAVQSLKMATDLKETGALTGGLEAASQMADARNRALMLGALLDAGFDHGGVPGPDAEKAIAIMLSSAGEDPEIKAHAYALMARIALARRDLPDARANLDLAIRTEALRDQPLRLPDWYMLLAQADPDHRRRHVHDAYIALETVRPLLSAYDSVTCQSTFLTHMKPVFEATIAENLDADVNDTAALTEAEAILENYREAEVQDALGGCVPPLAVLAAPDLRGSKVGKGGEIIVYPVLLRDRIELIYQGKTGYGRRQVMANRDEVLNWIRQLRASLAGTDNDARWKPAARALYNVLIAPISDQFGKDANLIIVPDGALSGVPFAALTDADGEFLIRRVQLSIAPARRYAQPGSEQAGGHARVLAAALDEEVAGFSRLRSADKEARMAAGVIGGGTQAVTNEQHGKYGILVNNFDEAQLSAALSSDPPTIMHLATHAEFNGPDESFIVARDGQKISISRLREILGENLVRTGGLDLLILSACETAAGNEAANMGLAGAAIQSGAKSVLASLWKADDAAAAELMDRFYYHYRQGASKSEALRGAQLDMIGKPEFSHPSNWANFVLIGGWR